MENELYGYYKSPIGTLKIVCLNEKIISVNFVDDENDFQNSNKVINKVIEQLDQYFKGTRKYFDIDCFIQGTEFQKKVWNELVKIPYGETISYKELARRISNEKLARAVGNANNKNKIAIIIPCHRVIGENGHMTGYAAGIERKKWLIEHEKKYK